MKSDGDFPEMIIKKDKYLKNIEKLDNLEFYDGDVTKDWFLNRYLKEMAEKKEQSKKYGLLTLKF